MWEIRACAESHRRTGRKTIYVRWPETSKGDDENPNIRSRLVAREIRMAGQDATFSPAPHLESLRMILSFAFTSIQGTDWQVDWNTTSETRTQVLLIDISRASSLRAGGSPRDVWSLSPTHVRDATSC